MTSPTDADAVKPPTLEQIRARDAEWSYDFDGFLGALHVYVAQSVGEVVSAREWAIVDRRELLRMVDEQLQRTDRLEARWIEAKAHATVQECRAINSERDLAAAQSLVTKLQGDVLEEGTKRVEAEKALEAYRRDAEKWRRDHPSCTTCGKQLSFCMIEARWECASCDAALAQGKAE